MDTDLCEDCRQRECAGDSEESRGEGGDCGREMCLGGIDIEVSRAQRQESRGAEREENGKGEREDEPKNHGKMTGEEDQAGPGTEGCQAKAGEKHNSVTPSVKEEDKHRPNPVIHTSSSAFHTHPMSVTNKAVRAVWPSPSAFTQTQQHPSPAPLSPPSLPLPLPVSYIRPCLCLLARSSIMGKSLS